MTDTRKQILDAALEEAIAGNVAFTPAQLVEATGMLDGEPETQYTQELRAIMEETP